MIGTHSARIPIDTWIGKRICVPLARFSFKDTRSKRSVVGRLCRTTHPVGLLLRPGPVYPLCLRGRNAPFRESECSVSRKVSVEAAAPEVGGGSLKDCRNLTLAASTTGDHAETLTQATVPPLLKPQQLELCCRGSLSTFDHIQFSISRDREVRQPGLPRQKSKLRPIDFNTYRRHRAQS